MKDTKLRYLIGLIICALMVGVISSCSTIKSEDTTKWDTFNKQIEQTCWEGTLTEWNNAKICRTETIKIVFYEQDNGGGMYILNDETSTFQYKYSEKILRIYNINNGSSCEYSLADMWWFQSFTTEQLSIRTNIHDDNNYVMLNLQRLY